MSFLITGEENKQLNDSLCSHAYLLINFEISSDHQKGMMMLNYNGSKRCLQSHPHIAGFLI